MDVIPMTYPLMMWVPRHAAALLNRYRRGEDGFTSEERRTGRAWRKPAIQFGERVQFKPAAMKRADLAPRLQDGALCWTSRAHGLDGVLDDSRGALWLRSQEA